MALLNKQAEDFRECCFHSTPGTVPTSHQVNLLAPGWSDPCPGRGERWEGGRATPERGFSIISPEVRVASGPEGAVRYSEGTRPSGGGSIDVKGTSAQRLIASQ